MIGRRTLLKAIGTTAFGPGLLHAIEASNNRPRLAVVTTEWRYPSHAWHMAERFLTGYPIGGKWH